MKGHRRSDPRFLVRLVLASAPLAVAPACGNTPVTPNAGATGSGAGSISSDSLTGGSGVQAGNAIGGTSAATSTTCPAGAEQCDCYGNGTCNAGLVCASNLCVNLSGWLSGSSSGGFGATAAGGSKPGNTTAAAGVSGMGGSAAGGAAATGGVAAIGGQAAATGGSTFWTTVPYSASGAPTPADGHHDPGQNCVQCHVSGSTSGAPVWMFGGTIYQADATTPAASVQVGLNDGTNLYTTYTAANGNFWLAAQGTINWAKAQVRIRNANGELTMAGATPASSCNLCHNSTTFPRITAP